MRVRALLTAVAVLCTAHSYAAIKYVDKKVVGGLGDGSSWANAFTTIQAGINAATSGVDQVWVGSGTYSETRTSAADGALVLKTNVPVYGGFRGNVPGVVPESTLAERDWFTNVTIIDGSNGRGAGLKAYHVVNGASLAVLDGFTVQNGDANGASNPTDKRGGGIQIVGFSMTVRNCIIQNNNADNVAGGIILVSSTSTIERCIFKGNVARSLANPPGGGGGGAMCIDTPTGDSTIRNCVFYNNSVTGSVSGRGGGALMIAGAISPVITNCTFSGNISPAATATPAPGTGAAGGGGAVYVLMGATPAFRNCIFWGDTAGAEITNNTVAGPGANAGENAVLPTLTNCLVQGGYAGSASPAVITTDPLFANQASGDLRILNTSSPARNAGTNTGAPSNDYLGTARPLEGTTDIGAYEHDITPPTVSCSNYLLLLNGLGTGTVTAANVDTGSSDAGGIKSQVLGRSAFNCTDATTNVGFGVGVAVTTYTVTDFAGNSATCPNDVTGAKPRITVSDVSDPVINSCASSVNVSVNVGTCQATVPNLAGSTIASDNCGTPTKTQSPVAGSLISSNTNVTITATDGSGNDVTCSALVTLVDTQDPVITQCALNQSVNANASCQAALPNLTSQVTATDNCGTPTVTQSPVAGTVISGNTLVTFTVTDAAGNDVTCSATISLADVTDPTITVCPPTQNLSVGPACTTTVPNLTALTTATDNCGTPTLSQLPAAGTVISTLGTTNVTVRATDGGGNIDECVVALNVQDTTNPTISVCASNTTVNLGPACDAALPSLVGGVTAADNCGAPTITQSPVAGTIITASTLVTLTATDGSGNIATCQATVDVQDVINPVITTCPPDRDVSRSGICDALVPDITGDAVATDNCGTPTITQSPTAGTLVTTDTVVTVTATDGSGNFITCTSNVTLVDDQDPVIQQCAVNTTVNLDTNCEAIMPDLVPTVSSTDNCAVASTVQSPVPGTTILVDTVVTFTVTDTSGNTATCQATVSVDDIIDPVITTCAPDQTLSLSALCDAQIPDFTATTVATDNCTIDSITQVPVAGTVITADTVVTITVTDNFGNIDTCTANALVVDDTAPVITLNGGAALAYLTGQPYVEQGATAADNCDTNVPVTIGGDVVNSNVDGVYIVTYNAVDDDGNNAIEVTRQVTYTLNSPPVITIDGDNPALVECHTSYSDAGATAFDSDQGDITGDMITAGVGAVDVNTVGDYPITYTVTDNANTTVQEVRIVQVRDNTIPVLTRTGPATVTHECSTEYLDLGATATDTCDLNIDDLDIIVDNPVSETTQPGDYTVTYTVTDASGNDTSVTRTVQVRDTTIPVLTLIGGSTVQHECGTAYNDLGASAADTCDGDITALIVVNNPVNANSDSGDYTVTYDVLDASNNAAVQISRTVQVRDTIRPVITLNGTAVVAVNVGNPYTEQGATANDVCDGSLTTSILTTGSVNVNVPNDYFIRYNVTDTAGNPAVEVVRTVRVQGLTDPPTILDQPDSLTVNYGASAQFSIVAASPVAFTYRWTRNNVDISDSAKYSGTTTATLTVSNCANADEADYRCRVTNIFGNATSDPATLTVLDPAIVTQPASQTVPGGSTVNFTVGAVGSGTLQYQWFFDGDPVSNNAKYSGATTATLTLIDAQNPDEGEYVVTVTGADGTLTSEVALLEVGNPAIITNPVDVTLDPGDNATFQVIAQGTPPLLYRWRKNGVNLTNTGRYSGTNTSILTITGCTEADEAAYDCVVVGIEIVVSDDARLFVNDPPVLGPIVASPVSAVLAPGANGTLTILVQGGTPPFTYQWKKDGQDILTKSVVNGTAPVLNVTNAQESDEGQYTCVVTNSAGSATSAPRQLSVGLTIFTDLADQFAEDGTPFTWPVGVGGGIGNLVFVWSKEDGNNVLQPISDGGGLTGTQTDVLNFNPVAFTDSGRYQVQVSDNFDSVTSRIARLTVVSELPVAGGLGLALAAGAAALLGAAATRRKK